MAAYIAARSAQDFQNSPLPDGRREPVLWNRMTHPYYSKNTSELERGSRAAWSFSCSRNARPQKGLVRRAHSRINQAALWRDRQANLAEVGGNSQAILLARRGRTIRMCSLNARSEGQSGDSLLTGCGKTISAQQNFDSLHVWDKSRTPSQDAQKGRPARPQRVKGRGGTNRTSCGPFAPRMDLGERKSPFSASDLRESHLVR